MCFLRSINTGSGVYNIYSSLFPDLDKKSKKPLHVLVAPKKHFESISEMDFREYAAFTSVVRKIQGFYLKKGYGPAVIELRLHPGSHTLHVHVHLIFSSDPLGPLNKNRGKKSH